MCFILLCVDDNDILWTVHGAKPVFWAQRYGKIINAANIFRKNSADSMPAHHGEGLCCPPRRPTPYASHGESGEMGLGASEMHYNGVEGVGAFESVCNALQNDELVELVSSKASKNEHSRPAFLRARPAQKYMPATMLKSLVARIQISFEENETLAARNCFFEAEKMGISKACAVPSQTNNYQNGRAEDSCALEMVGVSCRMGGWKALEKAVISDRNPFAGFCAILTRWR